MAVENLKSKKVHPSIVKLLIISNNECGSSEERAKQNTGRELAILKRIVGGFLPNRRGASVCCTALFG